MSQDGKYQKQGLIGSGERVDVFLGLNVAFGRKVAIKELRGGVDTSTTERNAYFSDYEKWAKFEHVRLTRIEDIDRTRAWVIQEYLPSSIVDVGPELRQNISAAYTAFEQLLEGLDFLHSQGFMHCHLKASNVRMASDSVKLCDGRCIQIGFPGSLPKPRGSNRYLAPEMINGEFGNVGTASDIYVAGMIMLEVLAGDQFDSLFKGYVSGTPDAEMGWVRWHNSPEMLDPIHDLLPSVPKPLADILDGMLCKQVQIRYASAERLLTDLRAQHEAIISAVSPSSKEGESSGAPMAPGESQPAQPAHVASGATEDKVKLIDRPGSAAYVRCLSGPLAGSIFPLPMGEVLIGDGSQCNVRLSPEQYPTIRGREIRIALGSSGWQIADSQSHPIIADNKKSFEAAPIRSGSIFRLGPRGPDFQFVVQGEHDWTWQDIASKLNLIGPETNSVPSRLMKKDGAKKQPSSAGAAPAAIPRAIPKAISAPPSPPQPVPGKENKQKSKPRAAKPAPPSQPVPAAMPAAPTPPSAPPSAPSGSAPARPTGDVPVANESFVQRFKNMDKNKRNNLILIAALPVMAILVILFVPRSKTDDDTSDKDKTAVVQENGEGETGSSPNSDAPNNETPSDEKSDSGDETRGKGDATTDETN